MSNSTSSTYSYLIIGSGVFGASTAYHLSRKHPAASIILIDRSDTFPCELAASNDINKIVRADYSSKFYCKFGLEALRAWNDDDLFTQYFYPCGMVMLDDSRLGKRIIKNYRDLHAPSTAVLVNVGDFKTRYASIFSEADYEGVGEAFVNPASGVVEATRAVRGVMEAAIKNGVKYIKGDVQKLLFDDNDHCIGTQMKDKQFLAREVVLCTGAGTATLLADSAPDRPLLHSNNRITAAGLITGIIRLNAGDDKDLCRHAPILVHAVGKALGDSQPTQNGLLKFCVYSSFTNTTLHEASGQMISAPPNVPGQGQDSAPQSLKDECRALARKIYGSKLDKYEFESYRMCWDAITPNQDFIISKHPGCKNLYIATGGSFHAWKFLPVLGKYIVQMLDGTLHPELVKRWAWDREQIGNAQKHNIPHRDLTDLL